MNLQKGNKKLLNAWAFYDWANSVYTLTIASTIFPIFYATFFTETKQTVYFLGYDIKNTALISFVTAFTFLIVAVLSPLLSGVADYLGNKKVFLKFFCYLGGFGCIGLNWFSLEYVYLSFLFYFLGLLGYWGSLVFYNSYLPDIAYPEQQDRVSAKGFVYGYVGSVLLLVVNLAMILKPEWFNISGTENEAAVTAMRYSFVTVGIWWIVFSQYTFAILPKGLGKARKVTRAVVFNGVNELRAVWVLLQQNLRLKRYLYAFFVSSMAVQTIILIAAFFGEQEINWGSSSEKTIGLITSILIIQIVAIFGAWLTSKCSERFGNINTLIVVNGIWLMICISGYFIYSPIEFYVTAGFVGLVMGGVQALSRSTYSKFLPVTTDTTSYFSFYDVAEKIGIVIGMIVFGTIDQITGSMRNSLVFLFVFFLIAIILLFRVPRLKKE